MGFLSFFCGFALGATVVFIWRDDLAELWDVLFGEKK